MPYISTTTATKIEDSVREELKRELGDIITEIPGKTENRLMLSFNDEVKMYFRGDDSVSCAYVEVSIFGTTTRDAYDRLTARICELYERKLGIPADRIYIKYEESNKWGCNGVNL